MPKINNVIRIKVSSEDEFFRYWFTFLKPFHNLTNVLIKVISCFMKHRFELSSVIKDANILDKVVLDKDIQNIVMKECNIKASHFQVTLGTLRRKKVIVDGKLNPKFIPNLIKEDKSFKLLLLFEE